MWKVYDTLLEALPERTPISSVISTDFWTLAETESGDLGMAMTTFGDTVPPMLDTLLGKTPPEAARAVKSWNLPEASAAMAVINACYNTIERMEALCCAEPYDRYCTQGVDFTGKTVGLIGHLGMPEGTLRDAKEVYILERHPRAGDYPDSACEFLLPKCDIVLITGSSLVNKTLPRLLELCRKAYTIVTGPTVPMCPELLGCGIDRLAGMVITDRPGIQAHVRSGRPGPPYPYGETFLLTGD